MTAAGVQEPPSPEPYVSEEGDPPTPEIVKLWQDVGNGIDKSAQVVWKKAVDSLSMATTYLRQSKEARFFVEKYMANIVSILVEQQPSKIGIYERNCVNESLMLAVTIVANDLQVQNERNGTCTLLSTLMHALNRKKAFYKGVKGNWNVPHMVGLPEVRLRVVDQFREMNGFVLLHTYMMNHMETSNFPKLEILIHVLAALGDAWISLTNAPRTQHQMQNPPDPELINEVENQTIAISEATMLSISRSNEETLKKIHADVLNETIAQFQKIFDRLVVTRRQKTIDFYCFWRDLALKLIRSQSLPLKLFGWSHIEDLIEASAYHRPPPRAFIVSQAGCAIANGRYEYSGPVTLDGYTRPGCELSYMHQVPVREGPGGVKKLTIFRCTMRSQQKWWFLSEADEEQPGTDRDIDYYQHKSKEHEEAYPPPSGWITACRAAGVDPPPLLEPDGLMVPVGQEFETLDHQLARWAIENEIVEQVLGDTTIHREVVSRSTVLIKFLAAMCDRYSYASKIPNPDVDPPKQYCLQASHLLFAWKTCLRKADAAVSAQVYYLLVSILPLCPVDLTIPLLRAIQSSLKDETDDKRSCLFEVSEFCSALASNLLENKKALIANNNLPVLNEEVRAEALNLMWSVLTHSEASDLRSYDSIKLYMDQELRVEPTGADHRKAFMQYCTNSLSAHAQAVAAIDERAALLAVRLSNFVIDACPREQAEHFVNQDNGALPKLLFEELRAYLMRRKNGLIYSVSRKSSVSTKATTAIEWDTKHHLEALNQRLKIMRFVFGLSERRTDANESAMLTYEMIETLWCICDAPDDRAALMVFIASASHSGKISTDNYHGPTSPDQLIAAAFDQGICHLVFVNLFCSSSCSYDHLGSGAYKSFQFLLSMLSDSPTSTNEMKNSAIDALWRICLTVEDDSVSSQARRDLLDVYVVPPTKIITDNESVGTPDGMMTDETKEDSSAFIDRMLDCLSRVRVELEAGTDSALRSADRCLRILNAAIGLSDTDSSSIIHSCLVRLSKLKRDAHLDDVIKALPHGMRGQAVYRRVGIIAKQQNAAQTLPKEIQPSRNQPLMRFSLYVHPFETLASLKAKVAVACNCGINLVKPFQVSGVGATVVHPGDAAQLIPSLNAATEDSVVDELGIVEGCEIVFVITDRVGTNNCQTHSVPSRTMRSDLSGFFYRDEGKYTDKLLTMLLGILKSLPWKNVDDMNDSAAPNTQKLAWDFLLALPTNIGIKLKIKTAPNIVDESPDAADDDPMDVDSSSETWNQLLDARHFDRSVYVLLTIDALLRPAKETVSILPQVIREALQLEMDEESNSFRRSFIESGGFAAVVRFFASNHSSDDLGRARARRGNAVILRILKACLFGNVDRSLDVMEELLPDELGSHLLTSLSYANELLSSLISMVIDDSGISSSSIADVLRFVRILLQSSTASQNFISLPTGLEERFLAIPLMHAEDLNCTRSSATSAALTVRRSARDLILQTPVLADTALQWLVKSIDGLDFASESTSEYFDVLEKLISGDTARSGTASMEELQDLGTRVCMKLASCTRPSSESEKIDYPTGVLCGCLMLLRALIENGGHAAIQAGSAILLAQTGVERWSNQILELSSDVNSEQLVLVDLMGCIFDGFLTPGDASSVSFCCDKESRRQGFDVVKTIARLCLGKNGFLVLVRRVSSIIDSAAPNLRHRWGQFGISSESSPLSKVSSKYSGLRNQGCTCYMNSVLQQLFMMPGLRDSLCSAPIPSLRRTSGVTMTLGSSIVGKRVSLQWENGLSYDAIVETFNKSIGTHCIRYLPLTIFPTGGHGRHQIAPDDIARLPLELPEEFVLSEGRPGKETGVFQISATAVESNGVGPKIEQPNTSSTFDEETQDEADSRHLLEEVQRTFIHLDKGSRGRCFDPRALVEACTCLRLEFDVWQQNDASEFATKLLDRMETSLKKYAPDQFQHLDHMFGIKLTKQKICKECGLVSNREEKHINIDCQIRGKADIIEALAAMTEDEIMEGSNRVYCERCKKNTDTILRTAISTMPNMLILSLKRFDLDFNTFETVKVNSRCAFSETLNLKPFTLEGLEAVEKALLSGPSDAMETDDVNNIQSSFIPSETVIDDESYEYKLVGVLVHAGVAQGGHYYSFIKERHPESDGKWYRFDDEDVTPFDSSLIELECFGGRIKKETKWPNGQVHAVEQEQFANALMLFYEKVKPDSIPPSPNDRSKDQSDVALELVSELTTTGYDVFKADVQRSNSTHHWQAFLFDSEFREFMKNLLIESIKPSEMEDQLNSDTWRQSVVQLTLSFLFDVLMYSSDRDFLGEWTKMIEESLLRDSSIGCAVVHRLAQKTREVSSNWIRTFLLECPDPMSRAASVYVFVAAIKSSMHSEKVVQAVEKWCLAWDEQVKGLIFDSAAPCALQGQWALIEDLTSDGSSAVGIILSCLNVLLEAMPRYPRLHSEMGSFIRDLALVQIEKPEFNLLRRAIKASMISPRLVALAARDRLQPAHYRRLFPGSSVSLEVAATQVRHETSRNIASITGNHIHNTEANTARLPSPSDYASILEALAAIAGLPGASHASLTHDSADFSRNRRRYVLSDVSVRALTEIFVENVVEGDPGMSQREVERFLHQTRVESSQGSSQRIQEIMMKYATNDGLTPPSFLSLDGFLAYYRDTIQSNDIRLRHDLNLFGFRPDLTRRPRSTRFVRVENRVELLEAPDSVAHDVSELFRDSPVSFSPMADECLLNTSTIYLLAFSVSEPLALYLVAGACHLKASESLIDRILQGIYQSNTEWSGNDTVLGATLALQVIGTLPDQDQESRISRIMESTTPIARNVDHGGVGLLPVLRHIQHAEKTHHHFHQNDLHWTYSKYIEIIKTLRKSLPIYMWFKKNSQAWIAFERDLVDIPLHHSQMQHRQQPVMVQQSHTLRVGQVGGFNDFRRDGSMGVPISHYHSDSDLNAMDGSEDDDDSQLGIGDHIEPIENSGPYEIVVLDSGSPGINGVYSQDGYFNNSCRYMMEGHWNGKQHCFSIFCCNVSNNTKHWYISIVPTSRQPGTSDDIDFYTAPATKEETVAAVPPRTGWIKAPMGVDPPPFLEYRHLPERDDLHPSRYLMETGGIIVADEDEEEPIPLERN